MTDQPHSGSTDPWSGSDEHISESGDNHSEPFAEREEVLADSSFQSDSPSDPTSPVDAPSFGQASDGVGKRRSRSRGGRRRRKGPRESDGEAVAAALPVASIDDDDFDDAAPLALDTRRADRPTAVAASDVERPPRRRTRGGRGRGRKTAESDDRQGAVVNERVVRAAPIDDFDGEADVDGFDDGDEPTLVRAADGDSESGATGGRKRRRRGSRGGRRRKKSSGAGGESAPVQRSNAQPSRGGSKAGARSERPEREESSALWVDAVPGEEDDLGAPPSGGSHRHASVAPSRRGRSAKKEVELDEEAPRRKSSRRRRAKGVQDDDEVDADTARRQAAVERDQLILVNAVDPEETRVVVEQGGKIVDLVMTVNQHKSYVNDIYRGRVVNIEDAIGAAFVDFGQGRNGFLHASDVMHIYGDEEWRLDKLLTARTDADEWQDDARAPTEALEDGEPKRAKSNGSAGRTRPRGRKRLAISDLLKRGQLVVAQITKDAIGDKGPTLTTYISIPGRYLVLMPSLEKTGVSRKIEDDRERRRLKRILTALDIPPGMGVIVRTAGIGKSKEEIRRDLDYLLAVWESFSKNLILGRNPAPLYQESAVSIRTMRDLFSSRTKAVIVDDERVYHEMREFTEKLMPEHLDRIQLHDGQRPLFHSHGIEPDFEKLFSRRVELPSGGSIVFDQTEALVAIDVNSGRTRDEGADFEDIALKANLEAVPEIARQIKLRDLGGIIVVDFIDMMRPASRRKVEKAFCALLDDDRARNKVGRISQFGLLELTRQRLGPGLSKLLYEPCVYCRGTGRRRTAQSKAQAVLRRLGSALTQKGFTRIDIIVHPDTLDWLKKHDWKEVMELEHKSARELVFVADEEQHEDSVFHYLRADGREVRPGGRRRR